MKEKERLLTNQFNAELELLKLQHEKLKTVIWAKEKTIRRLTGILLRQESEIEKEFKLLEKLRITFTKNN